jgi:hypothetical protein
MLAFSAASDRVQLDQIGISAAIVNDTMFLVGGLLIARPGNIAGDLLASGAPVTLELTQRSIRPLELGLAIALLLASLIRESHPKASATP